MPKYHHKNQNAGESTYLCFFEKKKKKKKKKNTTYVRGGAIQFPDCVGLETHKSLSSKIYQINFEPHLAHWFKGML
ncbi:hypothetical protein LguiA_005615 [Lonicera macranthoides]